MFYNVVVISAIYQLKSVIIIYIYIYISPPFHLGVQNEAGQRLIELCQDNALVIANTLFQQYKRRLYTWTSPKSD